MSPTQPPPERDDVADASCPSRLVLARTLSLVADAVVVHDGITIEHVSAAAVRLLGQPDGKALNGTPLAQVGLAFRPEEAIAELTRPGGERVVLTATSRVAEVEGRPLHVTVLRQTGPAATAMLRESQRLAQLGSWELDLVANQLYWSDEIFRIFEIDAQAFGASYDAFLERVHPEDRATVDDAFQASVRNRTRYEITHRLLMSDGRVKHVLERGETHYSDDGKPVRSIGTVQDVTGRVVLEKQLRQRNHAFDTTVAGIAFAELDGRITSVNPAFLRLWGYSSEDQVLGRHATEFWAEPEQAGEVMQEMVARGSATAQLPARRHDGSTFTAQIVASVAVETDGRPTSLMAHFLDVTDQLEAKAKLRRQGALLQSIIDATPDWVFAKDLQHRYVLVNRAFAEAQGLEPDDMLGRPDTDFWDQKLCEGDPATGTTGFHDDDRRVFGGESVRNPNDIATVKGGDTRIFDTFKGPLRDGDGRAVGVFSFSRDVTAQREAARQVERELKEKELLLAEVHHRVKNNMQVISSLLYLQQQALGESEAAEALRDSSARVSAMALVHERLYASGEFANVDLASYARDLGMSLLSTFSADPTRVSLVVTGEASLPVHVAVPCGLILNELISNSCKHAFPDGRRGSIGVELSTSGNEVLLAVCDDGVGAPAEPPAGKTLGLRLLPRIAAQMGATLERVAHAGTCFSLRIPRSEK